MLIGMAGLAALGFIGFHGGSLAAKLAFPPDLDIAAHGDVARPFGEVVAASGTSTSGIIAPLFGVPDQSAPPPPAEAPVENTTYQLEGITISDFGSWAMLNANGSSRLVREGDALGPGETVAGISVDTVILDTNGTLSFLRFAVAGGDRTATLSDERLAREESLAADFNPPQAEPAEARVTTVTPTETPDQPPPPTLRTEQPPLQLQELRQALYRPNALSDVQFVRARLTDGGVGLRLKWFRDNPLVEATGLQRGDVLKTINDIEITDAQGLQALVLQLPKLDQLVVSYERKEQQIEVTIPLIK